PGTATGIWVNPSYDVCYCLLAAAALRPGMRHLGRLSATSEAGATKRRVVLLGCASLAVPIALLSVRVGPWDTIDLAAFAFVSTIVPALVVYRLVDLVAYAERLADAAPRSGARMAAILNATPLPVRVLDPAGEVELMNDAAA